MGLNGTDVAKGSANIVLTDDNFTTIVTAVKEGRSIFENIRKVIHFLLSCNIGEVFTVLVGMLIFGIVPFSAVQLLWINLVTDSTPAIAIGMEPPEKDVMEHKPKSGSANLLDKTLGINIGWQGVMFAIITLISFALGKSAGASSTMAFITLSLSQVLHSFNIRSSHSIFTAGYSGNKAILGAAVLSIALILIVTLTPMSAVFGLVSLSSSLWSYAVGLALVPVVICEIVKAVTLIIGKLRK